MQEVDRRKRKETPENDSTRVWKSCWNLGLEVNSLSWTKSTCLLFFGNLIFSLEKKNSPHLYTPIHHPRNFFFNQPTFSIIKRKGIFLLIVEQLIFTLHRGTF